MNNFKFYVQELKKIFSVNNDYTIDSIITSDNDVSRHEFLVPQKVSEVKEKRRLKSRVIMVHRNSDAYDFFITEYRGNRMSEDDFGNVLVPENDYYASSKTR